MELPKRKRLRLEGYDYSGNGAYFLTLCSKDKEPMFSKIVGRGFLDAPITELTANGQSVEDAITYINQSNPKLTVEHHVIMPNHVHLLVRVNGAMSMRLGAQTETWMRRYRNSFHR